MADKHRRKQSVLALLLLLPASSLGVYFGMILLPGTILGQALFFACKLWLLLLPLLWLLLVEKRKISVSKPRHGGFGMAALLGLLISGVIVLAYVLLGQHLIEPRLIKEMAANNGFDKKTTYLVAVAYWIGVNSVLEEYVWRWFVVEKFSDLLFPKFAIAASALGFTIHHIVAMRIYFGWGLTLLGTAGIFIGGAIWSWLYLRYRSVWPGYLSHACADLAIFSIGWHLIYIV